MSRSILRCQSARPRRTTVKRSFAAALHVTVQLRLLVLTLSLTPALALAQTTTSTAVSLTYPLPIHWSGDLTNSTKSFNGSNCNDTLTLQWDYYTGGITGTLTTPLTLWATTATSCEQASTSTDVVYPSVQPFTVTSVRSGTFLVPIAQLPAFNVADVDGGVTVTCGQDGVEVTQLICGAISYTTYGSAAAATVYQATPLTLTYDTKPPTAPVITGTGSLDSSASVAFTEDADTITVNSQYSVAALDGGDDVWSDGPSVSVANGSKLTISNLTNTVLYDVRLFAVDGAGNVSVPSAVAQVTPVHTVGFFETLRNDGSTETGGCAVTGSMLVPLAALGLLRALARRSR